MRMNILLSNRFKERLGSPALSSATRRRTRARALDLITREQEQESMDRRIVVHERIVSVAGLRVE
jgi:hypothetical protein